MAKRSQRRHSSRSSALRFEALEPRAMFTVSPVHVVLPAWGVLGATMRTDGSLEIYAAEEKPFPVHLILGDGGQAQLDGADNEDESGLKQWLVSADGRLLSKTTLESPTESSQRTVYAVSPDGGWFVGLRHSTGAGDQGNVVVWKRETNDLIPVGVNAEQTGDPMVRGISNDGRVLYMAYVGEELCAFVWDRQDGLLQLKSTYEHEGNTSPGGKRVSASAISADGRTIVGSSGGIGIRSLPTVWRDGIPATLAGTSQFDETTDTSATSVSDDGRVIGGYVHLNTPSISTTQGVVWVDGNLILLKDASNWPAFGPASVVNGIGGDPTAWAAVGTNWIARSDGVARALYSSYLPEQFGLSHYVNAHPVELLASDDALYVVTFETPSAMCAGFHCSTSGKIATHVLVLPHVYSYDEAAALDLSGDGHVSPLDVLIVIETINSHLGKSLLELPTVRQAIPGIDANGDGELSAGDALTIIEFINRQAAQPTSTASITGEGESPSPTFAAAADEYFLDLGQPRRKNFR